MQIGCGISEYKAKGAGRPWASGTWVVGIGSALPTLRVGGAGRGTDLTKFEKFAHTPPVVAGISSQHPVDLDLAPTSVIMTSAAAANTKAVMMPWSARVDRDALVR